MVNMRLNEAFLLRLYDYNLTPRLIDSSDLGLSELVLH